MNEMTKWKRKYLSLQSVRGVSPLELNKFLRILPKGRRVSGGLPLRIKERTNLSVGKRGFWGDSSLELNKFLRILPKGRGFFKGSPPKN